jgi:hypothetical protein
LCHGIRSKEKSRSGDESDSHVFQRESALSECSYPVQFTGEPEIVTRRWLMRIITSAGGTTAQRSSAFKHRAVLRKTHQQGKRLPRTPPQRQEKYKIRRKMRLRSQTGPAAV